MSHFLSYFGFRLKMVRHGFSMRRTEIAKGTLLPAFFLFVGVFMFVFLFKAFRFFQSFDLIGEILIGKLLALIFFIFFIFLVLSNINGVIKWFLANEDLPFLLTNPVSTSTIFFTRSIEALLESSWAFLFFSIPVLLAYYTALAKFKPAFLLSILLLLPYALIPYGIALHSSHDTGTLPFSKSHQEGVFVSFRATHRCPGYHVSRHGDREAGPARELRLRV